MSEIYLVTFKSNKTGEVDNGTLKADDLDAARTLAEQLLSKSGRVLDVMLWSDFVLGTIDPVE